MTTDDEQNTRLRELEAKFNLLSNDVSAMVAKIDTLTSVGKGILLICAAMVGIDVTSMAGV